MKRIITIVVVFCGLQSSWLQTMSELPVNLASSLGLSGKLQLINQSNFPLKIEIITVKNNKPYVRMLSDFVWPKGKTDIKYDENSIINIWHALSALPINKKTKRAYPPIPNSGYPVSYTIPISILRNENIFKFTDEIALSGLLSGR